MHKQKHSYIIHADKDGGPSRFLVDLKKLETGFAGKKERTGWYEKISDRLAGLDFDKACKKRKKHCRHFTERVSGIFDRITAYRPADEAAFFRGHRLRAEKNSRLQRLAIFPFIAVFSKLFVFVFKIIYRACFEAGWLGAFIIRLAFFSVLAALRSVLWSGKTFFRLFGSLAVLIGSFSAAKIFTGRERAPKKEEAERNIFYGRESRESAPYKKETGEKRSFRPHIPSRGFRRVVLFIIISAVIILPFKAYSYYRQMYAMKDKVLSASAAAVGQMTAGTESIAQNDFSAAGDNFKSASEYFLEARSDIGEISGILGVLKPILPEGDIKMAAEADTILRAGNTSAELAAVLSRGWGGLGENSPLDVKGTVNDLKRSIDQACALSAELKLELSEIDASSLPDEYRDKFAGIAPKAGLLASSLAELKDILGELEIFLGFEYDRRYLLVFENNAEMRASGGFIGSFARLDLSDGQIKNLKVPSGGSYDTEGGLYERIVAPEPLWLVNPLWHFWDANWWPDWPASAGKLAWFYEKSGGPTVDGVIAITPTVIENMLRVIGPVDMGADYGFTVDADNFWDITQTFSEEKPKDHPDYAPNPYLAATTTAESGATSTGEVKPEPKKIIGDLLEAIRTKLSGRLDKDTLLGLISVLEQGLREKHILPYFRDDDQEAKIIARGWGGEMNETGWDYLLVADTNIAGGKSDRVIKEKIDLKTDVGADGSVVDTLVITRTHTGAKGDKFTGVRNNDWMRIYVPAGSELVEASGFSRPDSALFGEPDPGWQRDPDVARAEDGAVEDTRTGTLIYEESGKTVFANWSQVDPGQTAVITFKYRLPFSLKSPEKDDTLKGKIVTLFGSAGKDLIPYALMAQKQPGSAGSEFTSVLSLPDARGIVWRYPANENIDERGWKISTDLSVDRYYAVLMDTTNRPY